MIAAASRLNPPSRLSNIPHSPVPRNSSDAFNRASPPPPYSAPGPFHTSLPSYTPIQRSDEQTVQSQPTSILSSQGTSNSTLEYVYSTKDMTLNLGRRVNGTDCPSYGRNGLIVGTLTVHSFKHAKEVSITIWGRASIVVTDRGFPVLHDRRLVLFHTISLWELSKNSPRPKDPQTFSISFPIPTYTRGRSTLLPPTMSNSKSSIELEVRYSIVIDMYRQGFHRHQCTNFHRHQCTNTVFYYLPRSTPTSLRRLTAAFEEVEDKADELERVEWRMVDAMSQSKLERDALIQFGLPLPLSYAAGMKIPFRITIISLDSELSDASIRSALTVRLVRSTFLTIAKQRLRIERVIANGNTWKVEKNIGGGTQIWEITGSLVGTKPGGETSWGLSGFMEVHYSVRMNLGRIGDLSDYSCEENVQMVTDESTDEFDLDEARERPALGLIEQQVGIRSPPYCRT